MEHQLSGRLHWDTTHAATPGWILFLDEQPGNVPRMLPGFEPSLPREASHTEVTHLIGDMLQPTYVAFRMQGKESGALPKGLPPVPDQQPIPWLVVVALRQWNRVKDSLATHADDKLMLEGHPVVAGDGTHVLLVQSCVSMGQQREKKQAQR